MCKYDEASDFLMGISGDIETETIKKVAWSAFGEKERALLMKMFVKNDII